MPRQARFQVADTIYHITSRGDRREAIYKDDIDRQNWLRVLEDVCHLFDWRVHAFCQMGNHYHLVAETPENNLSAGMHRLNGIYTQRFNYRHEGSGHLFQGRYHAEIVHRQAHLLETMRYVLLNPVRAGVVATPGSWPWSSYAMTCDAVRAPAWLETEWLLAQFGERYDDAVMAFRKFVADGMENGDRPAGPVPDAANAST
jgi:REP element-mobilizing transposase RayT